MPNNLTGDFEAVVQVSIRQLNGLLATLHQNGATGGVDYRRTFPIACGTCGWATVPSIWIPPSFILPNGLAARCRVFRVGRPAPHCRRTCREVAAGGPAVS